MLNSRFFCQRHIATMLLLCLIFFTACQDSSNNDPSINDDPSEKPGNPTGGTWVEFKNLEEFPVIIYNDPARQVVFAEIPATGTKKVPAEPAPVGRAFYPTFRLMYPIGTTGTITIPYNGPGVTTAILADKTNTVSIPKLESIVTNSAYIMFINNSSFSLTFNEGPLEKSPLGGGPGVINAGLNAAYEITSGSVSAYSVLRNGSVPVAFPDDLSEFKAGIIYTLTYNGTALTVTDQLPINIETVPGNNLAMKLKWLESNILSNNNRLYFIKITADENISSQNLSYSGKSGITIFMSGDVTMCTVTLSSYGDSLFIGSGVTLILGNNITLKGLAGNNKSLVRINSGGTLVMNGGKISGNTASSSSNSSHVYSYGGGVYVEGTFTMNGGEISGNMAHATASNSYSTFSYGGGVCVSNGTFTMNGGKISGNRSIAGYNPCGGGVYVTSGSFIMNGGEISGNTAANSYPSLSLSDSSGGGVYVGYDGIFRMGGGVIYGNNAAASLKNTAVSGVALRGTAQYGTFTGDTFYPSGNLTTTDNTIRVVNGNLLTE